MDKNLIYLTQTDTTIGFLSNDFRKLNKIKQKILPALMEYIIEQPKLIIKVIKNEKLITAYMIVPLYTSRKLVQLPAKDLSPQEIETATRVLDYFIEDIHKIYNLNKNIKTTPVVADFTKDWSSYSIKSMYDQLARKGTLKKHLEFLKERIDYLKDIDRTEDDIYVTLFDYKEPFPLSTMGSGFISLVKLTLLISLAEKGVVILEEPEISLHPRFVELFTEEIVKSSEYAQFFISTHSVDLLEYLLKNAKKHGKLDDVCIIRLHRRDRKTIEPEVMDGNEALEYLEEIGGDLRLT